MDSNLMHKKLIIFVILLSVSFAIPNVDAATVSLIMDKTTYSYGEKLFYVIEVSEVTGDPAILHIRDETGKGSSAIPVGISELQTPVPSLYPFEKEVFPTGKYFIDVEYSGGSDTIEFEVIDSGNIVIPFWIKQVTYYWISDEIDDNTYADSIEFLIENKIIVIPETHTETPAENKQIPNWIKFNALWWLEEKISDTEFALALQHLIKVGIIVI